jgi:hypothetical protein
LLPLLLATAADETAAARNCEVTAAAIAALSNFDDERALAALDALRACRANTDLLAAAQRARDECSVPVVLPDPP